MPLALPQVADTLRCSTCKQDLPEEAFHRHRGTPRGRQWSCRACIKRRRKPEAPYDPTAEFDCRTCGEVKIAAEFFRKRASRTRPVAYACKSCQEAYRASRSAARRASARRYRLKLYGLTLEQEVEMLAQQGGRCAICHEVPNRPCVDHDHATGAVRAILCNTCNCALGYMKDRPDLLRAAATYLEAHRVVS